MKEIKTHILEFIWSGKDVPAFQRWLYDQNSIEVIELIGEENYIELIGSDFKTSSVEQVKKIFKTVLPKPLIEEFEEEFERRKSLVIKGKCIRKNALDYYGRKERIWGVEIGREYQFITIKLGLERGNHSSMGRYIDRENHFQPRGFIPLELFEVDLENSSKHYHTLSNSNNETTIEIKAFSDKFYQPTIYSFWEDFFDDDEKAETLYFATIEKLGINHKW